MGPKSANRPPLYAEDFGNDKTHHLLLAASGSVATIKLPVILVALSHHSNLTIRVILTKSSLHFLQSSHEPSVLWKESKSYKTFLDTLLAIPNVAAIHLDEEEWTDWSRGAPILHIELRRWAHLLVIAPLSANTLAKISHGMADNLLCSVARAWDTTGKVDGPIPLTGKRKQILVAPAMNTAMWLHPVTAEQVRILEGWAADSEGNKWIQVLRPQAKELACGDVGDGAMKNWTEIVKIIEEKFGLTG